MFRILERMFRICFYVTIEYNNPRIMPETLKQTPCTKKILTLLMYDLIIKILLFFYDKKAKT